MPDAPWTPYLAIAFAALATYSLRLGGLLLADRLPRNALFQRAMQALPGSLMFSIVVPAVASDGLPGMVAAGLTGMVAYKTGSIFAAMLAGMGIILLARWQGLA